tara:strand:- start:553 stop:915 length:363 start_codon:yes stop_codon:yes gene_type:complete
MKNYTIQERFFIFIGLICLGTWFTGYYYHYKWDKEIQESMQKSDEIAQQHVINSLTKSMAIDHWKSMYLAQKNFSIMLEKQVDVINDYWSKENSNLKDELFDLKNTPPNHTLDAIIPPEK